MNKYCSQPIRVMSEAVLQQCEHDMVHEYNETGWEWGSNGAGIYVALKLWKCVSQTYKQAQTHILYHGLMVTDCCNRIVH